MSKPWLLPKLMKSNRNAMTVYAALRWMSGESRKLGCTRNRIGEVCGLSKDTITDAVEVLNRAGWIRLNYGRDGKRTWYRLSFPVPGFFPVVAKTPPSKRVRTGKNTPQQTVSCTGKNPPHSLRSREPTAVPAPAPPKPSEAEANELANYLASAAEGGDE